MSVTVLFAAGAQLWPRYADPLRSALAEAGVQATLAPDPVPPESVDYIVFSPGATITDFTPYTRTKAVLNLWAGVEKIVGNPTLTQPLCRMVDPAMTTGMAEWVTGHAMRHHLGMDRHILGQHGRWEQTSPPLAAERPVAVLGFGELGQACARMLSGIGFPVTGWSRRPRVVPGLASVSGEEGLRAVLSTAQIVVTLMPLTAETENLMNAERLSWLPRGAFLINPGRGALIDDAALLAALASGQIAHATLDVFRTEPLPPDHPFWADPRVTVTPHIAAETRPETAARVIAENIRRGEAGLPLLHRVDPDRGY